jgi:hypothetical protein
MWKKTLKFFAEGADVLSIYYGVLMRNTQLSLVVLLLTHVSAASYAQVEGFQSAPFGVAMICKVIDGQQVCTTRPDVAVSAPPDKPCDATSRGRLISSTEYTTSSIRFCVTDTCANGTRSTDRIPYTLESYRVSYFVCGDAGWDLKCTTQTDYTSKCALGTAQVSCKDCDGKAVTFTPTTLSNPTRSQTSTPEQGCREVFARYRPQVETERKLEQLAYETILATSAIARTVATQSAAIAGIGPVCVPGAVDSPKAGLYQGAR